MNLPNIFDLSMLGTKEEFERSREDEKTGKLSEEHIENCDGCSLCEI